MATVENLTNSVHIDEWTVDVLNISSEERVFNESIKSQVAYNLPLHTGFIRNVIQCCNEMPLYAVTQPWESIIIPQS